MSTTGLHNISCSGSLHTEIMRWIRSWGSHYASSYSSLMSLLDTENATEAYSLPTWPMSCHWSLLFRINGSLEVKFNHIKALVRIKILIRVRQWLLTPSMGLNLFYLFLPKLPSSILIEAPSGWVWAHHSWLASLNEVLIRRKVESRIDKNSRVPLNIIGIWLSLCALRTSFWICISHSFYYILKALNFSLQICDMLAVSLLIWNFIKYLLALDRMSFRSVRPWPLILLIPSSVLLCRSPNIAIHDLYLVINHKISVLKRSAFARFDLWVSATNHSLGPRRASGSKRQISLV